MKNFKMIDSFEGGGGSLGFTLAEVLITLGIIGIVAAITMPTIITNYQKKVTVERLKSAYSLLNQAIQLSENHNGSIGEWNLYDEQNNFFDKYILPYMNTVNKKAMFSPSKAYAFNTIDGNPCRGGSLRVATNGVGFIPFVSSGSNYAWIMIDINGLKGPNRLGRDVFATLLTKEKLVMGWGATNKNEIINADNYGCKKGLPIAYYAGFNCGTLIMQDGWQITSNYPW